MRNLALIGAALVIFLWTAKARTEEMIAYTPTGADFPPDTDLSAVVEQSATADNVSAFLYMIRFAEGTAGSRGYNTMFGYRYFDDFSDHPRQSFPFTDKRGNRNTTDAAGAYQFLSRTWDDLVRRFGYPDFSPQWQDEAAIQLIRDKGALDDVEQGRFDVAVSKVRGVWASLPGAGYNQPERKMAELRTAYESAGGWYA